MTPEEKPKTAAEIAKSRLKQYLPLQREVEQLELRLGELESTMYYPKVPGGDGMPKASGVSDPTGRIVQQKDALWNQYTAKRDRLTAMLIEIEETMETLTPTERMLVRYKYMDGLTWEEVCVAMKYSWAQTHRIHSAALIKLGEAEVKAQE